MKVLVIKDPFRGRGGSMCPARRLGDVVDADYRPDLSPPEWSIVGETFWLHLEEAVPATSALVLLYGFKPEGEAL